MIYRVIPADGPSSKYPSVTIAAGFVTVHKCNTYFNNLLLFLVLCIHVCLKCGLVYVCSAHESQKREWESLEMELQAFVSHLAWALEAKCGLNYKANPPPPTPCAA